MDANLDLRFPQLCVMLHSKHRSLYTGFGEIPNPLWGPGLPSQIAPDNERMVSTEHGRESPVVSAEQ